jgi:hypothetical protein
MRRASSFWSPPEARASDFKTTLMIGRQSLYVRQAELDSAGLQGIAGCYAEETFRALGASEVDSLDASEYEGATIVHDLNDPLPQELTGRYTLVFDGGTSSTSSTSRPQFVTAYGRSLWADTLSP